VKYDRFCAVPRRPASYTGGADVKSETALESERDNPVRLSGRANQLTSIKSEIVYGLHALVSVRVGDHDAADKAEASHRQRIRLGAESVSGSAILGCIG